MQLTDLSQAGCFVATTAIVPAGSRVTLHAMLGGAEIELSGRVAHVQPGRGFGFSIDVDDLTEGARQQLQEFLDAAG